MIIHAVVLFLLTAAQSLQIIAQTGRKAYSNIIPIEPRPVLLPRFGVPHSIVRPVNLGDYCNAQPAAICGFDNVCCSMNKNLACIRLGNNQPSCQCSFGNHDDGTRNCVANLAPVPLYFGNNCNPSATPDQCAVAGIPCCDSGSNLLCVGNNQCACKAGYINTAGGACQLYVPPPISPALKLAPAAPSFYSGPCFPYDQHLSNPVLAFCDLNSNLFCNTAGSCGCNSGFIYVSGKTCTDFAHLAPKAVLPVFFGTKCSTRSNGICKLGSACCNLKSNLFCNKGKCACTHGHVHVSGKSCQKNVLTRSPIRSVTSADMSRQIEKLAKLVQKQAYFFVEGFAVGLFDYANGIWQMVSNPLSFFYGAFQAITHPISTVRAIGAAAYSACVTNPAKCIGYTAANIFVLFLPVKGLKGAGGARKLTIAVAKKSKFCLLGRRSLVNRSGLCPPPSLVEEAATEIQNVVASSEITIHELASPIIKSITARIEKLNAFDRATANADAVAKYKNANVQVFEGSSHLNFPNSEEMISVSTMRREISVSPAYPKYKGAADSSINAWMDELSRTDLTSIWLDKISNEFAAYYTLTVDQIKALKTWTNGDRNFVPEDMRQALVKLPPYEGIAIRSTRLEPHNVELLNDCLNAYLDNPKSLNSVLEMKEFVKNQLDLPLTIMAASPAGRAFFYEVTPYRLVIKSLNARYITPISDMEQEVVFSSAQSAGFRVVGRAKLANRAESIIVYYMEEVSFSSSEPLEHYISETLPYELKEVEIPSSPPASKGLGIKNYYEEMTSKLDSGKLSL